MTPEVPIDRVARARRAVLAAEIRLNTLAVERETLVAEYLSVKRAARRLVDALDNLRTPGLIVSLGEYKNMKVEARSLLLRSDLLRFSLTKQDHLIERAQAGLEAVRHLLSDELDLESRKVIPFRKGSHGQK